MASKCNIQIMLVHDIPTIWKTDYAKAVENNRIYGSLIGPSPNFSESKNKFGLPLRLMNVQAKLLEEKGLASIVTLPSADELYSAEGIESKYREREEYINTTYSKLAYERRKNEIIQNAPQILEGRQKKLQNDPCKSVDAEFTLRDIIDEEIKKIPTHSEFGEINLDYPFSAEIEMKPANYWSFPSTENENLRYSIFKDLWSKNYHITNGIKFGGDYLVYSSHPDSTHACFIVKCVCDEENLSPLDIISSIRVGTITKKTLVLASVTEDGNNVCYQSFKWNGENLLTTSPSKKD